MPECHNCPKNGQHSRDCIKCKGPAETNHKAQNMLHYQQAEDIELIMTPPQRTADLDIQPCCADVIRRLLSEFRGLNCEQLGLVCAVMDGKSLSDFARDRGISRQAAFMAKKLLIEKRPVLAVVFKKNETPVEK